MIERHFVALGEQRTGQQEGRKREAGSENAMLHGENARGEPAGILRCAPRAGIGQGVCGRSARDSWRGERKTRGRTVGTREAAETGSAPGNDHQLIGPEITTFGGPVIVDVRACEPGTAQGLQDVPAKHLKAQTA